MKKEILKFLVLAMLAIGAGPVSAAVWQWSKTAATNSTIDPTINWAEGMSPSSVNDSARAQMARLAEWRDDISGSIQAGGTSTAYTVATNQAAGGNGIGSPPTNGQMVAFLAATTNGAAATLSVDGGTAYPLYSAAGIALSSGALVSGTPYRVSYNVANSGWIVEGTQGNPYNIPLGGLLPYTGTTAPNSNFILPAGQCISTTTYAAYWALMGSPAPGACVAGQFQVADLRGRVLAALDNLNGSAASRLTSGTGCGTAMTSVGAVCTSTESFTIGTTNLPAYTPSGTVTGVSVNSGSPKVLTGDVFSNTFNYSSGGGSFLTALTGVSSSTANSTGTGNFNGTAQGGASTAIGRVQPTIAVTYLLRVI